MATPIIIFPSLSRAPSLDSGQKTFDDTIRDQMDLGYVATRPRFSRRRRTWTQNVRALQIEDVRALDVFANETVQAGAQSFYYPNLAPNWSFEFPAEEPFELVKGWSVAENEGIVTGIIIAPSFPAADGLTSIRFATSPQTLTPNQTITGEIAAELAVVPNPGEVYTGVFQWQGYNGIAGLWYSSLNLILSLTMSDGSVVLVQASPAFALTASSQFPASFQSLMQTFTIPAPSGGLTIASASLIIAYSFQNIGTENLVITGSADAVWIDVDCVGLALTQVAPGYSIYGRMVGSASLPFPVRFAANKNPAFSDLGFGDGVKRYGATFDLEEV